MHPCVAASLCTSSAAVAAVIVFITCIKININYSLETIQLPLT